MRLRKAANAGITVMSSLSMPTLRQAFADDWDVVRDLLLASDLPVDDLGPE